MSTTTNTSKAVAWLSSEIWSEILHYLPPTDIQNVVSSSLMESSTEIAERAAWLALVARLQEAILMPATHFPELELGPPDEVPWEVLALYEENNGNNRETFLGLYNVLFLLHAQVAAIEPVQLLPPTVALPHGHERNFPAYKATINHVILWIIFGGPKLPVQRVSGSPLTKYVKQNLEDIASELVKQLRTSREATNQETPPQNMPVLLGMSPARILQIVLRLADVGQWDNASTILSLTEGSFSQQSSIMVAEAKIFACRFRIDRVYARTYVDESNEDSQNILDAVVMGRGAVEQSLELMESTTNSMEEESSQAPMDGRPASSASVNATMGPNPPSGPPAALKSLFASPQLRVAGARLALARALASMGQHVGLGATDPTRFQVPLVVSTNQHNSWINRGTVAESLFEEGQQVIQASLEDLKQDTDNEDGANTSTGMDIEMDTDLLEVQAATIAARGELFYCAASANTRGVIFIRVNENALNMEAMTRSSMANLKESFYLVARELAKHYGVTVSAWCTQAPRSLVLLQCQTAKDLGKVHNFAVQMRTFGILPNITDGTNEEADRFLKFSHAVSLRLCGLSHPSVENIQRLRSGLWDQADSAEVQENELNEWLQEMFGNAEM